MPPGAADEEVVYLAAEKWTPACGMRSVFASRGAQTVRSRFRDRRDAGRRLAVELQAYAHRPDVLVLALPRGGVPVGYEVARALRTPLDVFVVRKLGVPGHGELAMGAIASGGVQLVNRDIVRLARVSDEQLAQVIAAERVELERRERLYRGDRPFPDLHGTTAILVDDGLATGSSMRAAIAALRIEAPKQIVVAVPIAAAEVCDSLRSVADDIICAETRDPLRSVGAWYEDFSQTTDEEVHDLLLEPLTGVQQ
jgi:putative phosphoribosyl transferase